MRTRLVRIPLSISVGLNRHGHGKILNHVIEVEGTRLVLIEAVIRSNPRLILGFGVEIIATRVDRVLLERRMLDFRDIRARTKL